jgi:hypothetical protein
MVTTADFLGIVRYCTEQTAVAGAAAAVLVCVCVCVLALFFFPSIEEEKKRIRL